jgi:TPR repeat protein
MSDQLRLLSQWSVLYVRLLAVFLLLILGASGCSNTHTPVVENHAQQGKGTPIADNHSQQGQNTLQRRDDQTALTLPDNDAVTPDTMFHRGLMCENGDGVAQDYSAALTWYRKAAAAGHAGAMNNLGSMYVKGQGVAQDYSEALKWYNKAAEAGEAEGMRNIGAMYDAGEGVPQDYAEAFKWYYKAAQAGSVEGMSSLGSMYKHGLGIAQNFAEAFKWYSKAAEAGSGRAMNDLGTMYQNGEGVPQDDAEALKWYRKAAEAGEPHGASNYAILANSLRDASSSSDTNVPTCTVNHLGDGAGIPCTDPYTGETTDFYDYKANHSHDPYE